MLLDISIREYLSESYGHKINKNLLNFCTFRGPSLNVHVRDLDMLHKKPIHTSTLMTLRLWLYSCDVQASCENNVSLYGIGSSFHFLVECRVTHNSCSIFEFTTCLIQSYNGSHYQAFRDICKFTNICKWSALPEESSVRCQPLRKQVMGVI